jgi:hypothetical protein
VQVFALGLIAGPVPEVQDLDEFSFLTDLIEDTVIQAEDFPHVGISALRIHGPYLGEALKDSDVVDQFVSNP